MVFLRLQRGAGEGALGGVAGLPGFCLLGFRHGLGFVSGFFVAFALAVQGLSFRLCSEALGLLGWIVGRFLRKLQYVSVGFI
ncbi:hypothetical protein A6V36_06075 [Paraburkholderia ginsengiterrae]|uniref:Uncharacterized protein n=1 Tax=Paraburkholderia ginsengiterrae TaxID=1462993 RepID=A0A1A9NHP3_9BURK|nr:hypothetical protein A6V36_06075 [Paraburkholderia ginsengiterrae]OAJ65705.1 hypothetical protein A6V37_14095 [Paraburkholderia ginsengiterrae]